MAFVREDLVKYSLLSDFDGLKFWSPFSGISLLGGDSRSNSTSPFTLVTSDKLDLNWISKGSSLNFAAYVKRI